MKKPIRTNQQGLASFIVVLSLMLIISLIVLSFTRIVRNEQRQALDRNLSARAFYAAESGVNTAVRAIDQGLLVGEKADCLGGPLLPEDYQVDTNAAANTKVTCLTVAEPDSLEYRGLAEGTSQVIPIHSSGASVGTLVLSWQPASGSGAYASCTYSAGTSFRPNTVAAGGWNNSTTGCRTPLVRVDLVPSGSVNKGSLESGLATFLLYPTANAPGTDSLGNGTGNNQGAIILGGCQVGRVPRDCQASISGLTGKDYYMRIVPVYGSMNLSIATLSGDKLTGAQVLVDSTGVAQDVVRRIQVRVPVERNGVMPAFALDAGAGLCKRIGFIPGLPVTVDPTLVAEPNCAL